MITSSRASRACGVISSGRVRSDGRLLARQVGLRRKIDRARDVGEHSAVVSCVWGRIACLMRSRLVCVDQSGLDLVKLANVRLGRVLGTRIQVSSGISTLEADGLPTYIRYGIIVKTDTSYSIKGQQEKGRK